MTNSEILKEAEKLMKACVDKFLLHVKKYRQDSCHSAMKKANLGFSIFCPLNDEYSELKYYEGKLIILIKKYLVLNIFELLFSLHNINVSYFDEKSHNTCKKEKDEKPYEFLINDNGIIKGYRFDSPLKEKEIESLIEQNKFYQTEILNFNTKYTTETKNNVFLRRIQKKYEKYISVESFFTKYFSEKEYKLYIKLTKEAVQQANEEIGLRTIRTMSGRNLSNFKAELLSKYANQSYQSMRFIFSDKHNTPTGYITNKDYSILNESFVKNELYKAFFGNEDFAKSFITSEYLFYSVGEKELFDYTSVICGYTKSIEQLIYKLLQINLLTLPSSNNLRIKSKNNSLIPFKKENEESFNTMLSSMINFLGHNKNGWNVSCDTYIISCLSDYKSSCRNEHFHKDNIYDYATVKRIRNNTILIFYYLLGGYKLTNDIKIDYSLLGIESDSFDRLYKKMQKIYRGKKRFILQFGNNEMKVIRLFGQRLPIYDENGSLKKSAIYFYPIDKFGEDDYDYACYNPKSSTLLIIDKDNLPEKVWWYDINRNERYPVEW